MFVRIIRDPALSTEEVCIRVYDNKIMCLIIPNNVLVSQFHGLSLVCSIDIYT